MKHSEYDANKGFTFAPTKAKRVKQNKTYSIGKIFVAMIFITCIVCLLIENILPL